MHLPPIGAALSIVFLFVLAESVTRPRLADIYEMAGRLLVSTALAFCLAAIFYLFVMVIGGFDTMYLNAVLAAIVFLVLFEPLEHEVETHPQFFFREQYDLETSGADLRHRLAHVLEIDEMAGDADGRARALPARDDGRPSTCAIQDGDGFDLVGSIGEAGPKRLESLGARPLLDRLERQGSISLEEVAREEAGKGPTTVTAAADERWVRSRAPSSSSSPATTARPVVLRRGAARTRTTATEAWGSSSCATIGCATPSRRRR